MKVLFLVQKEQRAILDRLYDGIASACECDIRWLTGDEQDNLRKYFRDHVKVEEYDRILFFLRFKKEIRQVNFIRTLPNLVILEHDAYQNYIPCKYTGKFSEHYRKLPWARVITSGAVVTRRLRDEGFDAVFIPKGYDEALLRNEQHPRDIELAFVGSLRSVAYSGRKAMLDSIAAVENLLVTRTKSGDEYRQTLSRIRFFASADVGMGEYMIKNFEAMACGCVLFAFDQGEEENRALGFVDLHNIVLYRDLPEFRAKLQQLREQPELVETISRNGQALAEQHFTFGALGRDIVEAMRPPLRPCKGAGWWERLRNAAGL
ncbi:glycosyltransferase family protein [Pseudomonas wadenswilerensis]